MSLQLTHLFKTISMGTPGCDDLSKHEQRINLITVLLKSVEYRVWPLQGPLWSIHCQSRSRTRQLWTRRSDIQRRSILPTENTLIESSSRSLLQSLASSCLLGSIFESANLIKKWWLATCVAVVSRSDWSEWTTGKTLAPPTVPCAHAHIPRVAR